MDFDKHAEHNFESLIASLQSLINIESVEGSRIDDKPFGEGPCEALRFMLKLANEYGFRTKNLDNYVGWAEWGSGDEMIGIPVHLDVVPAGNGWSYNPFGGEVHDGILYGRGAVDNKGPAIAVMYALKILKDLNISLKKRVRIIFGTNEETGMDCMKYYITHDEIPSEGFTPDAMYPIVNAEKGLLNISLNKKFQNDYKNIPIMYIKGGDKSNVVPNYSEARIINYTYDMVVNLEKVIRKEGLNIKLEKCGECLYIKSQGLSAHASSPQKGKNAIVQLIKALSALNIKSSQYSFIEYINRFIGFETDGKAIGINYDDAVFGPLTMNLGTISMDRKKAEIQLDIRYPSTCDHGMIVDRFNEVFNNEIDIRVTNNKEPHMVNKNSNVIKRLLKVYKDTTGENGYCISMGGGTYARLFNNMVAFGPKFIDKKTGGHGVDEHISLEDLKLNLNIYTCAIYELTR